MADPPKHAPGSPERYPNRLSFGAKPGSNPARRVIAHHIQITGYGHWVPNDPRGSNSSEIRKDELNDLGPIRPGRQPEQPSRKEIKDFYREATPLLDFEPFWFDSAKRQALSEAFAQVIAKVYPVWACAICSNHVHFCIRAHRDSAEQMWARLAGAGMEAMRQFPDIAPDHPVWSAAPWKVFLYTPVEVGDRVGYIERNPVKEGLAPQHWPFVQPYNNWPLHRR
jgi:REP element-mobilizing transposase RayT